jgi:chromosome segregation ATPase
VITTMQKNVEVKTYTIRNAGDKTRSLMIQHPVRPSWKLSPGTAKPEETTAQHYRFRVELPAKDTAKLAVSEEMDYPVTTQVNNLNSDLIAMYVRSKAIGPEAQQKLQAVVALKDRLAETQKKISASQEQINDLTRDQDRLRQNINNLRGLPGQADQVNRYAAKLTDQEKTMESLQSQLAAERSSLRQTQQELDRTIADLEI